MGCFRVHCNLQSICACSRPSQVLEQYFISLFLLLFLITSLINALFPTCSSTASSISANQRPQPEVLRNTDTSDVGRHDSSGIICLYDDPSHSSGSCARGCRSKGAPCERWERLREPLGFMEGLYSSRNYESYDLVCPKCTPFLRTLAKMTQASTNRKPQIPRHHPSNRNSHRTYFPPLSIRL
jgi:hypothetical protein